MQFQFGWFVDPLIFGYYPRSMQERVGDRLPRFTVAEREQLLRWPGDFLGLNYYSVFLAAEPEQEATYGGYWADIHATFM
jgi:beta-glucosidase/6-phospho-beta-glucosidase/beta-galactosidase